MPQPCKQIIKNIQCTNLAMYRYTWPGSNESFICDDHMPKLKTIADAIGLHLQIIPLKHDE